jgi:hypothetical protein
MPLYDTYIELLPTEEQSVQAGTYTYGYSRHIGIKGFQKLINKWAKCFLTLEGSDLSDRRYGTAFISLVGSNITTRTDLVDLVQLAVDSTNNTIRRYQSKRPSDDPRENLDDANLEALNISLERAEIEVFVRIRNQAGEVLRVQLPPTSTI